MEITFNNPNSGFYLGGMFYLNIFNTGGTIDEVFLISSGTYNIFTLFETKIRNYDLIFDLVPSQELLSYGANISPIPLNTSGIADNSM